MAPATPYWKSAGAFVCHSTCLPNDTVPNIPPNPIVSTALDGTITIDPFSLIASYNMFIARKCSATGLF